MAACLDIPGSGQRALRSVGMATRRASAIAVQVSLRCVNAQVFGEGCDDGNQNPWDGCDQFCQVLGSLGFAC